MAESFLVNYDTKKQYRTNGGLELFWMLKKFKEDKICVYTEKIAFNEDMGYDCELPIVDDDYLVESVFLFTHLHITNKDALHEVISITGDVQWSFEAMNRDIMLNKNSNVFAKESGIMTNSIGKQIPWYILGDCDVYPSLENYKIPNITDDRFMAQIQETFESTLKMETEAGMIGVLRSFLNGNKFPLIGSYVDNVQRLDKLKEFTQIDLSTICEPVEKMKVTEAIRLANYMIQLRELLKHV